MKIHYHTNDKILFRGTGWISFLICWAAMLFGKRSILLGGNGQVFSHIGFVIRSEDMSDKFRKDYNLRRHGVYLCESTSISRCYDIFGRKVSGVQIVKLKDKLSQYKGKCFHRPINPGPSKLNLVQLERNIRKFYTREFTTPYEKKTRALILSQLDFTSLELREDLSSLFCSEWCAFIDCLFGHLKLNVGEVTPTDYGNGLELLKGRKFGPIKRI